MAKLRDLPAEILIQIADEVGIQRARTSTSSLQHTSLDLSFGAVSQPIRAAFLEHVQRNHVFIKVQYHSTWDDRHAAMQADLDSHFNCSKASALYAHLSGHKVSWIKVRLTLIFKMEPVIFVANRLQVLSLGYALKHNKAFFFRVEIGCRARSKLAAEQIHQHMLDLGSVMDGFSEASVLASNDMTPEGWCTSLARQLLKRQLSFGEVELQYSHQTQVLNDLLTGNSRSVRMCSYAVLPLVAEALYTLMVACLDHPGFNQGVQYSVLVGLLFKGLADYLLASRNTRELQTHYLTRDGFAAMRLTSYMIWSRRLINILRNFDFQHGSVHLFQAYLRVVQARAHLSIALARAATIPGFPISEIVRKSGDRRYRLFPTRIDYDTHLREAGDFAIAVREVGLRFETHCKNNKGEHIDLYKVTAWYGTLEQMADTICQAVTSRGQRTYEEILMEPMLQLQDVDFLY